MRKQNISAEAAEVRAEYSEDFVFLRDLCEILGGLCG